MLSFTQFLAEKVHFEYLFHGTSSKYRASIAQHGLISSFDSGKNSSYGDKEDGVYVTTDFGLAVREAEGTVEGENGEEGVGGTPIVVVINRHDDSVRKLKFNRDSEYHEPRTEARAFWAAGTIPAKAIVAIVKSTDTKYQAANASHLIKQVGMLDKEGNPIVDKNGQVLQPNGDGNLTVYYQGKMPTGGEYWSTHPDSEYFDENPTKWMIVDKPNQFTIIDQLVGEVLLQPTPAALRKCHRRPKSYTGWPKNKNLKHTG